MRLLFFVIIGLSLIIESCTNTATSGHINNNDLKLLIPILQDDFNLLAFQFSHQNDQDQYIDLCNSIINDLREHQNISTNRKTLVDLANDFINDNSKPKGYYDEIATTKTEIRQLLPAFEKGELSVLENYHFAHKLLLAAYWKNEPSCNFGLHPLKTTLSDDTLLLYANTNYEKLIYIIDDQRNLIQHSFSIQSNTLQKDSPNQIYFKTPSDVGEVFQQKYRIQIFNNLTHESRTIEDIFYFKTISKDS